MQRRKVARDIAFKGNDYEARQTSKEQTNMPKFMYVCWKVHMTVHNLIFCSYTISMSYVYQNISTG